MQQQQCSQHATNKYEQPGLSSRHILSPCAGGTQVRVSPSIVCCRSKAGAVWHQHHRQEQLKQQPKEAPAPEQECSRLLTRSRQQGVLLSIRQQASKQQARGQQEAT